MTSLASLTDLGVRLGQTLTGNTQAQAALDDASAKVRDYLRFDFTTTTRTVHVDVCRGQATLPYAPVVSITSVKVGGTDVTYTWTSGNTVTIPGGYLHADIVYVSGWATVPTIAVAIVCQMAGRALGVSPSDAGGSTETLGSYSQGAATPVGIAGPLMLSIEERETLDRFTQRPRLTPIHQENWVDAGRCRDPLDWS